ncbi:DUF805 domain-containing protein [Massilia sp. W12]|uniref:DUF805 domain-containing protein n=1 Tax=Massilia sp. W12 TaxID=3126507 RepID=UPI0030CD7254
MTHPYQAPGSSVAHDTDKFTKVKIFALRGRIGRLRYYVYPVALTLLFAFPLGILFAIIGADPAKLESLSWLMVLLAIPFIGMYVVFCIRRLHDLDKTGWLCLLMLLPLVNLLFMLYLLFAPGTDGDNRYGAPPEPNTTPVIVSAVVLIGLSVLQIIMTIVMMVGLMRTMGQ